MTDDPKIARRKQFWARVLIVGLGLLALAQIIPAIWRWYQP